jgi:uncharacterized HAD superfamily protein
MIFYVDIDETICDYDAGDKYKERDYKKALPIRENIEKINQLYDNGHTVVYWTARGSISGIDWTELTVMQLKEWGVKYNQVKLGKPHYDLFICDKAINTDVFFENSEQILDDLNEKVKS